LPKLFKALVVKIVFASRRQTISGAKKDLISGITAVVAS